jgi:hypothetical protein
MEDVSTSVLEVATPRVAPDKPERTDAIHAGDRMRPIKSRTAKKQCEKITAYKWDSPQEPTRSEALEILGTRITNQHVVETCYDLALEVATRHNLIPIVYTSQTACSKRFYPRKAANSRWSWIMKR